MEWVRTSPPQKTRRGERFVKGFSSAYRANRQIDEARPDSTSGLKSCSAGRSSSLGSTELNLRRRSHPSDCRVRRCRWPSRGWMGLSVLTVARRSPSRIPRCSSVRTRNELRVRSSVQPRRIVSGLPEDPLVRRSTSAAGSTPDATISRGSAFWRSARVVMGMAGRSSRLRTAAGFRPWRSNSLR